MNILKFVNFSLSLSHYINIYIYIHTPIYIYIRKRRTLWKSRFVYFVIEMASSKKDCKLPKITK